ncbi:VWA domain-containing protein [Sulfolobus sp. E11-6]|uniref:VWA domain-containing protein n=1 Tax=Sulfolobus sp. E11-6 TaxID=2663020 RepID=UPI001EEC0F6D|nr:VWA domain-containing protein [Sulfolobus sp. E11-6]
MKIEEEKTIIKIANILRRLGRKVGVDEVIDAINALKLIEDRDFETIKAILRATMIKDFVPNEDKQEKRSQEIENRYSVLGKVTDSPYLANEFYIYSPAKSKIKTVTFQIENNDIIKWSKIAKRLKEITLNYEGHRFKVKKNGELDMRRTIKDEIKYSLESPYLIKHRRKINKSDIVLLCDISGSMKDYIKEILLLSFFIKRVANKSEIFYFSTDVKRVTNFFQVGGINEIDIKKVISMVSYGSGTRIGEALYNLRKNHGELLFRKCSVIIFSDGWDLGELELLERELRNIKHRCKSIIWINPLMDKPSYTPDTKSIKIALKYADLMISPTILLKRIKLGKKEKVISLSY